MEATGRTLLKAARTLWTAHFPLCSLRQTNCRFSIPSAGRRIIELESNLSHSAWVPNTDLEPLDCSTIGSVPQGKLSKSLYAAYQLAAENHDLDYFKDVLREFEASNRRAEKEKEEAAKAKASAKKSKKSKNVVQDEDEDVDMADAGSDEVEKEEKPKPSKKRKAAADDDEISTPKRTDSVKKPKLKLINSAQKAETPKSAAKEKKEKAKPKAKKAAAVPAAPKEPELSAEEKSKKKEVRIVIQCEANSPY